MRAPDQEVRERIVAARGVNLAVEAGAGTGKTTLLVDRVLDLVRTGTPLSRLAIITFTRKAAAELESRLVRALAEQRAAGAAWAAAALDELPRADLGTTDSFCRAILADFALEAGAPPGFALAAELAEDALRETAWARFLARSTEKDARLFERLRALGLKPGPLRQVADALVDGRDLPVARDGTAEVPDLVEEFADALAPALVRRARCVDPGDRLLLRVNELADDLAIARDLGGLEAERVLLALRRADKHYVLRQGRKEAWGGGTGKAEVIAALERLEERVDVWMRARGAARATQVAEWLGGYAAEYARLKRERGLVDFRDLSLGVRDLLRRDPAARARVAARWDALLLDEAQDTDPLQMEIALLLAAEEPVGDDAFAARLVPGRLFLVGDPKQSIYRFRRADLELYARTRASVVAGGESPAIRANFRCARPILDFVNRLFAGWMEPTPGTSYQAPYVELLPGRDDATAPSEPVALLLPDPAVHDRLLARSGAKRLAAEGRVELEADAVVRAVRRILAMDGGGPGWTVRDPRTGARPARPGDVGVLVRRMTGGERLLDALRRAGIPAAAMGGRGFHAREEIQTLLAIVEAVVRPDDPRAIFAALRSPALAIPDDELVLRFAHPGDDPRAGGISAEAVDAEARLLALAAEARRRPVDDFLEHLVESLAFFPAFGLRPDGPARLESLRLLVEAATPLAAAGFDSLPELTEWLRSRSADEPLALGEIEPGGEDAVNLLTIHKAKGLEFPIVVLADLGGKSSNADPVVADRAAGRLEFKLPGVPDIATSGYEAAAARESERRAAEELRLLYVGMTRARDRLVLAWTGGHDGFFAKSMLPARLGAPAGEPPADAAGLALLQAADLPALAGPARVHVLDPAAAVARHRAASVATDLFAAAPVTARAPAARRERSCSWSVSAWLSREDDGPWPPPEGAPGDADVEAERERAREFGSFVHAALEVFDPRRPGPDALDRAITAATRQVDPPADVLDSWSARLGRIVADPTVRALLAPAPGTIRRGREVPFVLPFGEDRLTGTIDRLLETPEGDLIVVDYKTDRLGDRDPAAVARRHLPQAALYARAARELTGRCIREVRLVMLDADPVVSVTFPVDAALEELAARSLRTPAASAASR